MVIGARINLHFDFGAAGNRAVKKSFAWDRRNPDVFGADQYHERNGSRPRWLLPLLVARCRIEGYRRPKVALRQLGRPAKALRADRKEKSAAALRPAHYANAIGPNKRLRLQKQQRPISVSRSIAIVERRVGGSRRAHFPPATRGKAIDHQNCISTAGQLAGPIAFSRLDHRAHQQAPDHRPYKQTTASMKEYYCRMLALARRPREVAVKHR